MPQIKVKHRKNRSQREPHCDPLLLRCAWL